jgi:hypothetical protein
MNVKITFFFFTSENRNFFLSRMHIPTSPKQSQGTGTCGQYPMLLFFFFFNIDFLSYKQHFATFYVSLYDIYTINTIKQ